MSSETSDPRQTAHHPRLRETLYGHETVESRLTQIFKAGRMHHAWLLCGPKGVGKATFAYRLARYVLRYPDPADAPEQMAVSADDPVFKRVAARGHADLLTVERSFDEKTKRLKAEIGVGEARTISQFFTRTAGEGGWRVCIVDAADELRTDAANALLKILEEPPDRSLLLLVTHQSSGRLLDTIHSRCVRQNFEPLSDDNVERVLAEIGAVPDEGGLASALSTLSAGSPGRAVDLLNSGAGKHLSQFEALVSGRMPFDRKRAFALAEALASRQQQDSYQLFCDLLQDWIMRQARTSALSGTASGAAASWSDLSAEVGRNVAKANALNLDRRSVMLDAFRRIEQVRQAQIAT